MKVQKQSFFGIVFKVLHLQFVLYLSTKYLHLLFSLLFYFHDLFGSSSLSNQLMLPAKVFVVNKMGSSIVIP